MKRSNLVSKATLIATLAVTAVAATACQGEPVAAHHGCNAPSTDSLEAMEDGLKHRAKISQNLQLAIEKDSNSPLDVLVVLNVPKPDLSHLFGSDGTAADSASPKSRDEMIDIAESAVHKILERTDGKALNRFRNAASVLARVSPAALEELAASDCVVEIVENGQLSN